MLTAANILGGAFRLVRERIGSVAIWALLYLAMNVAVVFASRPFMAHMMAQQAAAGAGGVAPNPAAMFAGIGQLFGVYLLLLVGLLVLYTAALRSAVRPAESAFAYLRVGMDELRMLAVAIVLGIGFMILYFVLALVAGVVGAAVGFMAHGAIIPAVLVLMAGVFATLAYFQVRFSLVFALTLRRRKIMIGESWTLTRGHFWTLFGAYFVLLLIVFASGAALFAVTAAPYLSSLAHAGVDPAALAAARQQQLASQFGAVTPLMMVGWAVGAVLGSIWIALGAGAVNAALVGLDDDAFAGIGAVYE